MPGAERRVCSIAWRLAKTNLLVEGIQHEFDQVVEVRDLVWVLWRRLPQRSPLALWGEEVQFCAGELKDEAHANRPVERCLGELATAALKKHLHSFVLWGNFRVWGSRLVVWGSWLGVLGARGQVLTNQIEIEIEIEKRS
jgi:hypothetical protein